LSKLWNDAKGAEKLLWTIVVLSLMLSMVAVFHVKAQGEGYATIYVNPPTTDLTSPPYIVGDTFTVEVRVSNYSQVAGYQVKLVYDNSLLNVTAPAKVAYAPDGDHIFPYAAFNPVAASVAMLNATHQYVMKTATTIGAVEYNGTDAGLIVVEFTIVSVPPKGETYISALWLEPVDTYTFDDSIEDNAETLTDGSYSITSTVANHLEVSPTTKVLPEITGDKIVGTDKAKFTMDVLIKNVSTTDDIIIVQWEMNYTNTYLNCTIVDEGTFMNNSVWAPYGTFYGWLVDEYDTVSRITFFVMINPNLTTGEWDWPERPQGEGVLATIRFEVIHQPFAPESVSFPLKLAGVFGQFFINTSIEYVPYGPPINATFTLNGYNYKKPIAAFAYSPEPIEVNKTATFDASTSYGWRNDNGTLIQDATYIKEYAWDWGDGTTNTTTTAVIAHTYSDVGAYVVNLTVTDYDDLTNSTVKSALALEVVSHTVTYDVHSFIVVTMSTGKIEKDSIVLRQPNRCLYFNVTGTTGTLGILNITIPNELLSAASQDWMVILQGRIVTTSNGLIVTQLNATHTMLSVTFTFASEEPVYIFGTQVIPEFPGSTFVLASMAISMIAAMSLAIKKKRKK